MQRKYGAAMSDDHQTVSGISSASGVERKIDRSPGSITEFPDQLESLAHPGEDENDYFPEIFEASPGEGPTLEATSRVAWPATDRASPCYSHLLVDGGDNVAIEKTFEIGKAEGELLIAANRYRPAGKNDIIAFGLRGARLRGAEKLEQVDRVPLEDARPDHKNFRCVIGYYFRSTGKFSVFTGSTVPWHEYMSSGIKNNLLPTGTYVYKKGTHAPATHSRWVTPALRLSDASGAHSGAATVLRTKKDLVFDLVDEWDECAPSDNIHCAYSTGKFSSLGCQTVKGGMHDGLWADFQAVLKGLPENARVDYVLFTGAEASIAAAAIKAGAGSRDPDVQRRLGRLRVGSESEEVKILQTRLGVEATGYFGAQTKKKLTDHQKTSGVPADGIFSPALDEKFAWGVFSATLVAQTQPEPPSQTEPKPA